jgi:hypothetical protein
VPYTRWRATGSRAGVATGPVDLGTTYTNSFVIDANKTLGHSG